MSCRAYLLLPALLAGCYPATGPAPGPVSPELVTEANARWPNTTEEMLSQGRELFLAKCNQCHGYPDIQKVGADKWPSVMKRMAKKAKLDAAQRDEVLHFILVQRASNTTAQAAP